MVKLAGILAEAKPLYAAISGDTDVRADSLLGKFVGLADHLFSRAMLLTGFFLVGLLAILLAYKYLSLSMSGGRQKS